MLSLDLHTNVALIGVASSLWRNLTRVVAMGRVHLKFAKLYYLARHDKNNCTVLMVSKATNCYSFADMVERIDFEDSR